MSLPRKKEQLLTTTKGSCKIPVSSELHAKSLKIFPLPLESKVCSDVGLCRVANILQPAEQLLQQSGLQNLALSSLSPLFDDAVIKPMQCGNA